jgi:NhaP-type Na+/H+ or K+/H+ antiporter
MLSLTLLLYGLAEILGGSGLIASLSFGLALRNIDSLWSHPEHNAISMDIKTFQSQILFLTRTFLFVSVGVILYSMI